MGSFDQTERRVAHTCERYPAFPREPAILVRLLKHLYKRIHANACMLLKAYGISPPEYEILMMLYGTPGQCITPTEVAEAAVEKPANITRLTDSLCGKGLLLRAASPEDRRKVTLTLQPAGLALIERLLPDVCSLLDAETVGLDEGEQLQLERLLKKMLDSVDRAG
ncbi:winged helix-turn-helix transcriptional regulator [Xanthomonas hyacinthi]|uniref:MarR family transcriptional regulator n=1 Tax=Xanthomonas hyacinthi TaxID=56455 RepID=A0A2S7F1A4_9XANT|nr:MarR family winged helix-turn-helix transcriptional regulator [Xanthomonas hyacinthi]KLD76880.1 MarR family transcriptional regulator [Xanthomonas hyacinthi DSM 19077]PPU99216.1 MarR family transcriptional regulator [Xanthomonas hyacinthi]QGY78199.1 winged helix-turn-helix transcriptional regulator [Xanthomonas hyacinthi]